jgi:hypothetical protein
MRLFCFAVFALLLVACQSAPTPGAPCTRATDCASPLVCRFGSCRSECSANRDCPTGAVCLLDASHAGSCSLDIDTRCESGGHTCPTGLVCVGDRCANTCTTNADCPSDGVCRMAATTGVLFCFAPGRDMVDAGSPIDAGTPVDAGPPRSGTVAPIPMPTDGNAAGQYVAMSADGTRAAVVRSELGPPEAHALDVLRRTGGTWELEQTLTANNIFGQAAFSDDGSVLVVLDFVTGSTNTTVRHFTRTGTAWAEDVPVAGPLTSSVTSIAIDATCSRVVIGAGYDTPSTTQTGSAQVYALSGGAWSVEADLTPTGLDRLAYFGGAAAISGDGATILVGASGQHQYDMSRPVGEVHVFTRVGATWTEQPLLLGATHAPFMGAALALSRDGQFAAVSAGQTHTDALVFRRNGATWSQEADLTGAIDFGTTVSLSGDGSRALIGSPSEPSGTSVGVGLVHLYQRSGATWSAAGRWAAGSSGVTTTSFGSTLALDASGTHAIVGDPIAMTPGGSIAGGAWLLDLP